jgi:hypothetical protein
MENPDRFSPIFFSKQSINYSYQKELLYSNDLPKTEYRKMKILKHITFNCFSNYIDFKLLKRCGTKTGRKSH